MYSKWFWIKLSFGLLLCVLGFSAAYLWAHEQLLQARQARRSDNYAQAEERLAKCWPLPGFSASLQLERELLAVQQGDLHAQSSWQSRLRLSGDQGWLILEALAKGNLAAFNWGQAETFANDLLDRGTADASGLYLRGLARRQMQREPEALQDLEEALKLAPDVYEVRLALADLLHQTGYVQSALEHYRLLGLAQPVDERWVLAVARCWQDEARLELAAKVLDDWLATAPDSLAALVERGRVALRQGATPDAETFLRRAVSINAEHIEANFVLGLALRAQQESDPELEQRVAANQRRQAELKLSLQGTAHTPELLTEVGEWMRRTGSELEAPGWLYAALAQQANFQPAHLQLSQFFHQAGQVARAAWHAGQAGSPAAKEAASSPAAATVKTSKRQLPAESYFLESSKPAMAEHAQVQLLCAACHLFPEPASMPRHSWREEVKQAYDFLRDSTLSADYPPLESVVAYYEERAPEALAPLDASPPPAATPFQFEQRGTGWLPDQPPFPAIANVQLAKLHSGGGLDLLLCDTRANALLVLRPYVAGPGGMALRDLTAPCHASACDLDGDGRQDMLVASLGHFFPTDDQVGKVLWLRGQASGQYAPHTLLEGVGRVADVQVADLNRDGRLDVVVAVFGWRNTGEILYLENETSDWSQPKFRPHTVDSRHGAIHLAAVDLAGRGEVSLVALLSQEHEQVVAYQQQPGGGFAATPLFKAPHPSYGCSGMHMVDLDADGDLDVLLTNGDVMDRPYVLKPYHGVQWLENQGESKFVHHHIGALYGAAQATSGDFDGDGDLDVAAVSQLPRNLFPERETRQLPSVVLFEQTAGVQFVPHVMERGTCDHFSCAAGDWDQDGRVDLAIGNFAWDSTRPIRDAASLWRNVKP